MSEANIYWKKWFFFLELKSVPLHLACSVNFHGAGRGKAYFLRVRGSPFARGAGRGVLATFLWDEIDVCHPCLPCVQSLYSDRISVPKVFRWITIGIARYMHLHCAG